MRQPIPALLLAVLLQVLCTSPAHAQDRTLPPPLSRGGLCPGILPCAESGPLAAHLRGIVRLTPPDSSSAPGAGMGADASFALSFGIAHQAELGASIGTSGVVSAWGRLTPSFLSSIGPGGAFSLGSWVLSETVPPQMDHGLYYLDAETYGLAADIQKWIVSATLYGAYKGADAGAYHGGEAGCGLWLTLDAHEGLEAGGELLARFGQHDGQPGQAQLVGFLGIRMLNEWGAAVGFGHARTVAGTGPWSASAVIGNSIGPSYLVPARSQSSLLEDLLAALRRPHLPTLHLPEPGSLVPGRSCLVDVRAPCVAAYGLSAGVPFQVGGAIEPEAREREPGAEAEAEPFEGPEARREREAREREAENDPRLSQQERDRLRIRHAVEARDRAQRRPTGPAWPDEGGPPRTSIGPARPPGGQAEPTHARPGEQVPQWPPRADWMPPGGVVERPAPPPPSVRRPPVGPTLPPVRPPRVDTGEWAGPGQRPTAAPPAPAPGPAQQVSGAATGNPSRPVPQPGAPRRVDYDNLPPPKTIAPRKKPTGMQRDEMYKHNERENGGRLCCDESGDELVRAQKSQKGVTPPPNEATIDHRFPVSEGGDNSYQNLRVIRRDLNRQKSNKVP